MVVLQLLDEDGDGFVTRSELAQLHLKAVEYATLKRVLPPKNMLTLVNALYEGLDRRQLRAQLEMQAEAGAALREVAAALHVSVAGCTRHATQYARTQRIGPDRPALPCLAGRAAAPNV